LLSVVAFLEFFRRDITTAGVKPLVVVSGNPFHSGEGDIPDAVPVDELFLVRLFTDSVAALS
jgi:hypothetical protein